MPREEELRELAIKIFFEENPEATTNPEEYELRAPEGQYYLKAQSRAMSGIKEDLYQALKGYETETENVLNALKELGEKPEGYATDEELQKQITSLENKLAQTERKLDSANTNITNLTAEKARLDELLSKQEKEPAPPPEFGKLRRREPSEAEQTEKIILSEEQEPVVKEEPKTEKATRPTVRHKKPRKVEVEGEHVTEISSSTRPKRKTRVAFTGKPTSTFQTTNESLVRIYDLTVEMLREGIAKGSTNAPLGLISFMAYADLLHGGAYAAPINELPFFMKDPTRSKWYAGELENVDVPQGLGGWLGSVLGGLNAGPFVQEIVKDSNVPHVFPKLLSDESYAMLKAVFAWFTSTDLLKSAGTGVKTFVEAGKTIAETGTQLLETTGKTAAQAAKNVPITLLEAE